MSLIKKMNASPTKKRSSLAEPRLEKIVVNVGSGRFSRDKQKQAELISTLALITGQKPVATKARVSVASFKIRRGMDVGLKVTLRGRRMHDFFNKLRNVVLPRIRDFRGVPLKSLDEKGNLSIGLEENIVFPELDQLQGKTIFGLEISIVTSAKTRREGEELFRKLGIPFTQPTN